MKIFCHMAPITKKSDVSQVILDYVLELVKKVGEASKKTETGTLVWKFEVSLDLSQEIRVVEIAHFKDEKAFLELKQHPNHSIMVKALHPPADWTVGALHMDYLDLTERKPK